MKPEAGSGDGRDRIKRSYRHLSDYSRPLEDNSGVDWTQHYYSQTMTKEAGWSALPGPSTQADRPRCNRGSTRLLASAVSLAVFATISLSINFGAFGTGSLLGSSRIPGFNRVPFNAKEILDKCAALKVPAGPPKDFGSRTVSDRFTPGTPSTIIYNARIWTGEENGTEVIDGFVWLKKGIVVAIGGFEEQEGVLKEVRSGSKHNSLVRFVDAGGKWVTPGLGELSIYPYVCRRGADTFPCGKLTCTRILGSRVPRYLSVRGSCGSCFFLAHGPRAGSHSTNSHKGPIIPWLRSIDGFNTHDDCFELTISGGVTSAQVLPGSANAQGGQAFVVKLRKTPEQSPSSMVIEPPHSLNGSTLDSSLPPRWRHMK